MRRARTTGPSGVPQRRRARPRSVAGPRNIAAAGRYTADFKIRKYGSYLLKAVHKRNGQTVAESLGSVALSYPLEYLRTTAETEPLRHAAQVSGGHDQAKPAQVWDAAGEKVPYTQDLWPYALLAVVVLFMLDVYAKRVRLFGYRTIKFS